ncbi:hypothetical protein B0H14DRAFT_2569334 [Mycena olivaceomarginata]|nr:hypothetical protein B0H14DRAFT_2569334 [Mycena olivaceomarginata]
MTSASIFSCDLLLKSIEKSEPNISEINFLLMDAFGDATNPKEMSARRVIYQNSMSSRIMNMIPPPRRCALRVGLHGRDRTPKISGSARCRMCTRSRASWASSSAMTASAARLSTSPPAFRCDRAREDPYRIAPAVSDSHHMNLDSPTALSGPGVLMPPHRIVKGEGADGFNGSLTSTVWSTVIELDVGGSVRGSIANMRVVVVEQHAENDRSRALILAGRSTQTFL